MTTLYEFAENIKIEVTGKSECLTSSAKVDDDNDYNMAIDGLEALLLSFASKGLLESNKATQDAVRDAIESIANNVS